MLAASPPLPADQNYQIPYPQRLRERVTRLNARLGGGPLRFFDDLLEMAHALRATKLAGYAPDADVDATAQAPAACVLDLTTAPGWRGARGATRADCLAAASAIARLVPPVPLIVVSDDAELVRTLVESDAWIAGVLARDAVEADWREVLGRVAAYELGRAAAYELGRAAALVGEASGSLAREPSLLP